ncbi:MAG: SDR family oxidoreductase [Bacillota bacterium]
MRVLYIGGTGQISYACLQASAAAGQQCTVFNRGTSAEPLPPGVRQITGDVNDRSAYSALSREHFDVVCQFTAYNLSDIERDIEVFGGHTAQYLFISTASAYQKPPRTHLLTEEVPLSNPYWPYSQAKADMEKRLMEAQEAKQIAATIVRPSHTYRTRFPGTFINGDAHAWRMLNGRVTISHGDGQSVWTLTHASDFAVPFVRLLGNPSALGEAFHVTGDRAYTWDQIFRAMGEALGITPRIVHVPTDTLVRYKPEWAGPLLGDKSWSALFDLTKLKLAVGEFECQMDLSDGLQQAAKYVRRRVEQMTPDLELHALVDRIAEEQSQLGA